MFDTTFLNTYTHALVDQFAFDGLPDDFPRVSVAPSELKNDAHLLPVLIPLGDLTPEQSAWLIENLSLDNGTLVGCTNLLATTAETKHLKAHLAARLLIHLMGSSCNALLRYYDPRVFAQLEWMLSKYQIRKLFGPIDLWGLYLDGAWRSVPCPQNEQSTWVFDAKCCVRLKRIGLINQTILGLARPLGETRAEISQAIDEALVYAQQHYQLEHSEDQIAFARHAVSVHRAFDRHPTIQRLIGRLAEESQTYADATALLSESDWQRIGIDLSS